MLNKRSCSSDYRISDELVIEILRRLGSSKYATQCKLVSKHWSSIINSSYFRRRWRQFNSNNKDDAEDEDVVLLTQYDQYNETRSGPLSCGQVANYVPGNESLELKFPNNIDQIKVVATHKDVVLFTPDMHNHKSYYLWNPFTMQCNALPRPTPTTVHKGWEILVGLYVYDDIDNYTFKFMVLRIVLLNSNNEWLVEMFSSENNSAGWTQIDSRRWSGMFPTNYSPHRLPSNYVFHNGMFLWYAPIEIDGEYPNCVCQIIGFKISKTRGFNFKLDFVGIPIGLPYRADVVSYSYSIGKCRERLRLSELVDTNPLLDHDYDPKLKLRIWQFDGKKQKWEFVHEFDFSEMEDSVASSMLKSYLESQHWSTTITVMNLHPYDEDIIYLQFINPKVYVSEYESVSFIISCDIRKRTFEVIQGFPELRPPFDVFLLLKPCWPTTIPFLPPP